MGCDIHTYVEKKTDAGYEFISGFIPFDNRSYGTFGFLADVRNYSKVTPISECRGVPPDASNKVIEEQNQWGCDGHSHSWLSVAELSAFNYEAIMEDRRYTQKIGNNFYNGAATCKSGEGKPMTYREFLGDSFINDIKELQEIGADRIIFWFDN